jgi:hypothetical protein
MYDKLILIMAIFVSAHLAAAAEQPVNIETRENHGVTHNGGTKNISLMQQVTAAAFSIWKRNVREPNDHNSDRDGGDGDGEHHHHDNDVVIVTVEVFVVLFLLIVACLTGFFIGSRKYNQDMAMKIASGNSVRLAATTIASTTRARNAEFDALTMNENLPSPTLATAAATTSSSSSSTAVAATIIPAASAPATTQQRHTSAERGRKGRKQSTILDDELNIYDVRAKDN